LLGPNTGSGNSGPFLRPLGRATGVPLTTIDEARP
jgi:hypothetical protein